MSQKKKKKLLANVVGDDGKLTVEFAVDKRREKTCVTNVENCNLQEGDIRLVKWSDGKFYQARILEIGQLYYTYITLYRLQNRVEFLGEVVVYRFIYYVNAYVHVFSQ